MLAKATCAIYVNMAQMPTLRHRRVARGLQLVLLKGVVLSLLLNTGVARAADQHSLMANKANTLHGKADPARHSRRPAFASSPSTRRYATARRPYVMTRHRDLLNFGQNKAPIEAVDTASADIDATDIGIAPIDVTSGRHPPAHVASGEVLAKGVASWYSQDRYNKLTASGTRFDENAMTAAHSSLPLGTRVRVTLEGTDESVIVTINDRLGTRSRVIDLSKGAARQLGILSRGLAHVTLSRS